jgi:hypothetical protein
VLAGEDAVKAAGAKYLPRLDSQSDEEYGAYKARASFFGATARTLEEYLDLVFRRAPTFALCATVGRPTGGLALGATAGRPAGGLEKFVADCERWGTEFVAYARGVVSEVLSVGRGGSLVLQDSTSSRPCVSFFRAEDVLDWTVERIGQEVVLTEVVLREADGLRVLGLERTNRTDRTDGARACVMEVWKRGDLASPDGSGAASGAWVLDESVILKRDGVALDFIPFVFHGPKGSLPERGKLPLADIIAANLDHYRLDADYKHGLHFAALPTAWVSGFDKAAPLRIGSSAAWVSEVPGASAGFLEFTGAGLAHLERAMEKVERRMALLGARMLESTGVGATGLTAATGVGGELCGLGAIVESLNRSLSRVLQFAQWWIQGGDLDAIAGQVSFAMNTDLGACAMSGEEITAVVAAWRAGAISRDSMLERLKRGEVLPDGRTIAQERALIHGRVKGL